MPSPTERAAFEQAHIRWAASDLEGFLELLTEDVLYNVNVDGLAVPCASSALGEEDVRQRLQLLLETFSVDKFEPESIVSEGDRWRSIVRPLHAPRNARSASRPHPFPCVVPR